MPQFVYQIINQHIMNNENQMPLTTQGDINDIEEQLGVTTNLTLDQLKKEGGTVNEPETDERQPNDTIEGDGRNVENEHQSFNDDDGNDNLTSDFSR
jgi:hypothetical protein